MFLIKRLLFIVLLMVLASGHAQTIKILPHTIIEHKTLYQDVTLDLNAGSFQIINNGELILKNCHVLGTISPHNPYLIDLIHGKLQLINNVFTISAKDIDAIPNELSLYNAFIVEGGQALINGNEFTIDKDYTVNLLSTNQPIYYFQFHNNIINHFHGGLLLQYVHDALIIDNIFKQVSNGDIFILKGNQAVIRNNTIMFSGNNHIGDGIDIVDSSNVLITNNYIANGSCYSIYILGGKHITLDRNYVVDGITYALHITTREGETESNVHYRQQLIQPQDHINTDIIVTNNYFAQNRYGLSALLVNNLIVKNNTFIQAFKNKQSRRFWTDNDILLKNINGLIWENNWYKEAFTQSMTEDNKHAKNLVPFPVRGGVIFEN